jgi:hypothetical protein
VWAFCLLLRLQFAIGIGLSCLFWLTGVVKRPQLDAKTVSSSSSSSSRSSHSTWV